MKSKEIVSTLLEAVNPDDAQANMQRYNATLTDSEKSERGRLLGDVLQLRKNRDRFWITTWGSKTDLGLFLTVEKILQHGADT